MPTTCPTCAALLHALNLVAERLEQVYDFTVPPPNFADIWPVLNAAKAKVKAEADADVIFEQEQNGNLTERAWRRLLGGNIKANGRAKKSRIRAR